METRPVSCERDALVLEATYELATPAFLGGADRNRAELRIPSLKGLLRFWWRALQAQRVQKLETLRAREDTLFGSAAVGQSSVSMRLISPIGLRPDQCLRMGTPAALLFEPAVTGRPEPPVQGLLYLGYGVIDTAGRKLSRACLRAPLEMRVRLVWRPFSGTSGREAPLHTRDEARDELCQALQALGLLGGVGARSRRGFGSMVLRKLAIEGGSTWQAPASVEALRMAIASLYARDSHGRVAPPLPDWTALSPQARHLLLVPRQGAPTTGLALLEALGREMVRFRSFGKDGKILGQEKPERLFTADHDLYKAGQAGRRLDRHPQRAVFGLPHNYSKTFHVTPAAGLDRRASPLLMHVHLCGATPVLVLSFLPSRFLPEGSTLNVGGSKGIRLAQGEAFWKPIHDFLDRLEEPRRQRELGLEQVLEVSHDR